MQAVQPHSTIISVCFIIAHWVRKGLCVLGGFCVWFPRLGGILFVCFVTYFFRMCAMLCSSAVNTCLFCLKNEKTK